MSRNKASHHGQRDRTAADRRQEIAAQASDEFWNRMELGRKESQRRAEREKREGNDKKKAEKKEKKEEKDKKGNLLWRKVLNRNLSKK